MTDQHSSARKKSVENSASVSFLAPEPAISPDRVVSRQSDIATEQEASKVVYASFGEWPAPEVVHPESRGLDQFIAALQSEGQGALLADGRKAIAQWFAPKVSLKRLRLEAGLSQDELALRVGTSQPNIARIESGKQDPSLRTLHRLAEALGLDIHKVVDAASNA